jgi:hypothetical protein
MVVAVKTGTRLKFHSGDYIDDPDFRTSPPLTVRAGLPNLWIMIIGCTENATVF